MDYDDHVNVELNDKIYSVYYKTQDLEWEVGDCYWCGAKDSIKIHKKVILVEVFNAEKMTEISVRSPIAKQLAKKLSKIINDDFIECSNCMEDVL